MSGLTGALLFSLLAGSPPALHDTAFQQLAPEHYAALAARLPGPDADAATLETLTAATHDVLEALSLDGVVTARVKTLTSTAAKMARKGIGLSEVADRLAVRVRVHDEADCYSVRDALHARFEVETREVDDYIAAPKPNGYRSLHTALWVPTRDGVALAEVQIRTHAMHTRAEGGAAAHDLYKHEQLGSLVL